MTQCINVILSGGSGTRLWPLSRKSRPKQFLKLFNGRSIFQHTIERNKKIVDDFMLITNASQLSSAHEQVAEIGGSIYKEIIEPVGRNTAPAIALACLAVDPETILFVTPSDQMIGDDASYHQSIQRAKTLAKDGYLVTFGICPKYPETGFGYIEASGEDVIRFREKPDFKTAQIYIDSGNFYWNSGMFCFKAATYLSELRKYQPIMLEACIKAHGGISNNEVPLELMEAIPDESIDYAVLEHSTLVKMVPSSFEWTDLGSFDSLLAYGQQYQNVSGLKRIEGTQNSYSLSDKLVVSSGLDGLLVVDTFDAILVLPIGESHLVKDIYNAVKKTQQNLI
jgi:mannose-1-phosphate guanylyltransferase